MDNKANKVPIKLRSLKEEREIIRSTSSRPRILINSLAELQTTLSENSLKAHNRTPALSRFRKIDSPQSIYESSVDANQQLIEKANATREILEIKEKSKQNSLLYKKTKGDRMLKSGIACRLVTKNEITSSRETQVKSKLDKKESEIDFGDEKKKVKRLSKFEAESLISRLQGGYKKH